MILGIEWWYWNAIQTLMDTIKLLLAGGSSFQAIFPLVNNQVAEANALMVPYIVTERAEPNIP